MTKERIFLAAWAAALTLLTGSMIGYTDVGACHSEDEIRLVFQAEDGSELTFGEGLCFAGEGGDDAEPAEGWCIETNVECG